MPGLFGHGTSPSGTGSGARLRATIALFLVGQATFFGCRRLEKKLQSRMALLCASRAYAHGVHGAFLPPC